MQYPRPCLAALAACLLMTCTSSTSIKKDPGVSFTQDLHELQELFHIPGMVAIVQQGEDLLYEEYFGYADLESQAPMDSMTRVPVASITKIFAGIAAMQLVESGQLSLEDPVSKYVPDMGIADSIQVRHILSHTSQGAVGTRFYYSYRFGLLTPIIEQASGQSFETYLSQQIIQPLELEHTFLLEDSTQVVARGPAFARPYVYEGDTQPGFIDYGYSAAAGIVSTGRDLSILARALLSDTSLLKQSSRSKMFQPFVDGSPYGLGIFSQNLYGADLLWGYGQYDCYSALLLMVPEQELSFILLANNNLLSDPARLIYGNIGTSLFARSFLNAFVWNDQELNESVRDQMDRDQALAQALSASFLARFELNRLRAGKHQLSEVFKNHQDLNTYADLQLLHTLMACRAAARHLEVAPVDEFDSQIEQIGTHLLAKDPDNPYANVYLGGYFDATGEAESARKHYDRILNAPNFSRFWYTMEAENWLKHNP